MLLVGSLIVPQGVPSSALCRCALSHRHTAAQQSEAMTPPGSSLSRDTWIARASPWATVVPGGIVPLMKAHPPGSQATQAQPTTLSAPSRGKKLEASVHILLDVQAPELCVKLSQLSPHWRRERSHAGMPNLAWKAGRSKTLPRSAPTLFLAAQV
jgi:hypothetical protein